MKVLAVGDIVGDVGVRKVKENLKNIIEKNKIDFVIIVENA